MNKQSTRLVICMLVFAAPFSGRAGDKVTSSVTVFVDKFNQVYEGGGVTYSGYWLKHPWSMNEKNQDLYFKLLFADANIKYVRIFINKVDPGKEDEAKIFAYFTRYMQKAKAHNADVKLVFVLGDYPEELVVKTKYKGKDKEALNVKDPKIYDKLAKWVLRIMQYMHDNGKIQVDIINVANEPDWEKEWKYGYEDARKGLGLMVQNVFLKLNALLKDKKSNPDNLKMPLLMGPCTLGPNRCTAYIDFWKRYCPIAWKMISIVDTHQYYCSSDLSASMMKIKARLGGRKFFQSEQHANKGDSLGKLPIEDPHRTILSLASFFCDSVNNGVESWFYYSANYPKDFHPGGLMCVHWGKTPIPYRVYYAFKQLHTIQSKDSCVVAYLSGRTPNLKLACFRKKGENKAVVHVANISPQFHRIVLRASGGRKAYILTGYETYVTDKDRNIEKAAGETLSTPKPNVSVDLPAYSLTSVVL